MFGFGKSKFKATAAEQGAICMARSRQFTMFLVCERPGAKEIAEPLMTPQPEVWIRLLTVAQLSHNLLCIYLQYLAQNPAGVATEYSPVVAFVEEMLVNHPELGRVALSNLREVDLFAGAGLTSGLFPRRGWGRWVINKLKDELRGNSTDPNAQLNSEEQAFAGVIDDYITGPYVAQFGAFYRG